jgi:hypothetical protein
MRVIGTMVLIEQTMTKENVSNYYDRWNKNNLLTLSSRLLDWEENV